MSLDENSCTDNEELQRWYHHVFENQSVQSELFTCDEKSGFREKMMILAKQNGFVFSRKALDEAFSAKGSPLSDEELEENGIEDKWARKIMILGWAPLGYSR